MRKNESVKKGDKWALIGIVSALVSATIGVVFVFHHMIESLDDNSKKLRTYHVKQDESSTKTVLDLADSSLNSTTYQDRHKVACSYYDAASKIEKSDPRKAIALYIKCEAQYQKDIKTVPPVFDDVGHSCLHHIRVGEIYLRIKNYPQALIYANKALAIMKSDGAYNLRANAYAGLGDSKKSAEDRQAAKEVLKEDGNVETNLKKLMH